MFDTLFTIVNSAKIAYVRHTPQNVVLPYPIIFLHDSLGCISVWKDFPNQIAELLKAKVIVYDREGYGQSQAFEKLKRTNFYLEEQADFLISFMNKLSIQKAYLFGHSDGGSIALIAASKYKDRISGIVTEGAHVFVEDITLAGIKNAQKLYMNSDLKLKLEKHHGDKTQAVVDAWVNTWLSPEFFKWNIEYFLKNITCPVCIIQGIHDEFGTVTQVESIYKNVCGEKEKHIVKNAAHTPHKENYVETLQIVKAFLKH